MNWGILKRLEKILYIFLTVVITTTGLSLKERLIDIPDLQIIAKIKAPLSKVDAWLESETGEKIHLPDAPSPFLNPIEVNLKNTGKKEIKNLEVTLEFVATGELNLLDERYSTKPEKGFGKISFSKPSETKRLVTLSLFNPRDEFTFFAFETRPVTVIAYSKFPGLSFYQEYYSGKRDNIDNIFFYSMIIFYVLSAVVSLLPVCFVQKRIIEQYGIRKILSRGIINVYWNDRTGTERLYFWMGGICLALISSQLFFVILRPYP